MSQPYWGCGPLTARNGWATYGKCFVIGFDYCNFLLATIPCKQESPVNFSDCLDLVFLKEEMLSVFASCFFSGAVPCYSKVRPEDIFVTIVSGKFSGANFCCMISISALRVWVPSSHSFCTDFFDFSPGNAGENFSSCQVWFLRFFRKIFGSEFLFRGLVFSFACFGAF